MVSVAQLVELQFVALAVAGSNPVGHPKYNTLWLLPINGATLLRLLTKTVFRCVMYTTVP